MQAEVKTIAEAAAAPAPASQLGPLARAIAATPYVQAISPVVVSGTARLVEFGAILACGLGSYAALLYAKEGFSWPYVVASAFTAFAALVAFQALGIYAVQALRSHVYQLGRVTVAWSILFLALLSVTFFAGLGVTFSRVWVAVFFGTGLTALFAHRLVLASLTRKWAREEKLVRRVIIVGGGRSGEALIDALNSDPDSDIRICGVFDDRANDRSPVVVGGVPKLGTVDDLVTFTRLTRVDMILVSLPLTAEDRVLQMVKKLWVLPVDVRLAAHMNRLRFRPRAYSYIGNVPVLDIFDKPIADWNMVLKTAFDRVTGCVLLALATPVMLAVALAVKLDSKGPILFRQKRFGFNNEQIDVLKFRSMYVEQSDQAADRLVTKGDPRVTRVGRIIRKTSLDELPQLINVAIKGDLSLVGPRPHAMRAKARDRLYEETVDGYFARHRVKPGITGWAQINGWRGETDTEEKIQKRVEYDLYYIENWSLLFDLYILARTPLALLKSENAY